MPAFSKIAAVAPCLALAASKGGFLQPGFFDTAPQPIMAKAFTKDPKLVTGMKTVQSDYPGTDGKYHGDYPKDDRPNVTGDASWTHVTVSTPDAGPEKYTVSWYKSECKKINEHCIFIRDHRLESTRRDLEYLENEYLRLKRILDDMTQKHQDEKYDVERIKNEIAEAEIVVKELSHCPPELEALQKELDALQAIADKTPSDIDKECDLEKQIIEKQKCVDKLRDAEDLLARHREALPGEMKDVTKAFRPIPRQEERVAEAKARWETVKARGIESSVHALELGCQKERDELMATLKNDVGRLYEIYMAERGKREGFKDKHAEEEDEADAQEKEVAAAKVKVDKAEVDVRKLAHCRPELSEAEARLASLNAKPDKTEHDIDEECEWEKKVLKARACVKELEAAEEVLAYHDGVHGTEVNEHDNELSEAAHAASFVPPQTSKTAAAKAAWLAAKARYEQSKCDLHNSLEL